MGEDQALVTALHRPGQGQEGKPLSQFVTISAHTSMAAEAYRTLRTSVKFLRLEEDCTVIQITSPTAAEGKTLTS